MFEKLTALTDTATFRFMRKWAARLSIILLAFLVGAATLSLLPFIFLTVLLSGESLRDCARGVYNYYADIARAVVDAWRDPLGDDL
jgi:hypothetical protein